MAKAKRTAFILVVVLIFLVASWGTGPVHSAEIDNQAQSAAAALPIIMDGNGAVAALERPAVAFNHEQHTRALKQVGAQDCGVCHLLKETDRRLSTPEVTVFRFPKSQFDETDKTATMYAHHQECVSCHRKTASEGKKAGPDIGLCGKCHVRRLAATKVIWAQQPIFNYSRHDKHVKALGKIADVDKLGTVQAVEIVGDKPANEKCEVCHHTYDDAKKKLVYKKNTENSCRACHKAQDEKNSRSIKKAAHSECIGCHMKLADQVRKEVLSQGRTTLTDEDKKRFGPVECSGCHGEQKELAPGEIVKIPRLVRGQKDVLEITLKDPATARMKLVPYNHKAHEPRAQMCNTCHHHSLEKCSNCHTPQGDTKKGGGVTFERAFHKASAQQACAGCHNVAKQDAKCQGCHKVHGADLPKSSCNVCHRGPSEGKPIDAPPASVVLDKEKVPEKLQIKILEKEFKPAEFPHQKIVAKLIGISNESSLARVFHAVAGDQTLCAGCHHGTDPAAAQAKKVPTCSTCHSRAFNPAELGKPGILGAYHRQCMGCHGAMKQKPAALECAKCHPEKEGVRTAGVANLTVGKGH